MLANNALVKADLLFRAAFTLFSRRVDAAVHNWNAKRFPAA